MTEHHHLFIANMVQREKNSLENSQSRACEHISYSMAMPDFELLSQKVYVSYPVAVPCAELPPQ